MLGCGQHLGGVPGQGGMHAPGGEEEEARVPQVTATGHHRFGGGQVGLLGKAQETARGVIGGGVVDLDIAIAGFRAVGPHAEDHDFAVSRDAGTCAKGRCKLQLVGDEMISRSHQHQPLGVFGHGMHDGHGDRGGGVAAFIDAEHALDPSWAKKLGIALETLLVSQPTSGEEAMQIAELLIKSNAVDIIVVDSVAALVPQKELDGEIGDSFVGLQARLMSQAMRKLTGAIAKSKTCVIFINQIREKIGVMFGSPETTPGGRALKFYSSCRIDVRRIGGLKDGEDVVGQRVRVKVVKNKVAPPFRVAEFDMMHADGISAEGDLLDLGLTAKLIEKSGTWMRYGDTHLGQGREKARVFLKENPEVAEEIRQKIIASREPLIEVEKETKADGDDAE